MSNYVYIYIYIIRHIHNHELEGHLMGAKRISKLNQEAQGVHVVQTFSAFLDIYIYIYT